MYGICSRLPGTQYHMPTAVLLSVWLWGPHRAPCPLPWQPCHLCFCALGLSPQAWRAAQLCRHSWRDQGLASREQPQPVGDRSWWIKHPGSLIRGHIPRACYLVPQRAHHCPTAVCSAICPSPPFYIFLLLFYLYWCQVYSPVVRQSYTLRRVPINVSSNQLAPCMATATLPTIFPMPYSTILISKNFIEFIGVTLVNKII